MALSSAAAVAGSSTALPSSTVAHAPAAFPFLSSTYNQLKTTASNASFLSTASNSTSLNLLGLIPKLVNRIGGLMPEQLAGIGFGMTELAQATGDGGIAGPGIITSEGVINGRMHGAASAGAAAGAQGGATPETGISGNLSFQNVRGFGGVFTYITSPWALLCLVMAVVLNRTHIYASFRRPPVLSGPARLVLRIAPILLFIHQILRILQTMRCQMSPEFSSLRYGDSSIHHTTDETGGSGGLIYLLSSSLLFWQTDRDSCLAVNMIPPSHNLPPGTKGPPLNGSLSLLWPLFKILCFSQFAETFSCALQSRPVQAEVGMTLFEHSLAFAEAEALASAHLGWGPFGFPAFSVRASTPPSSLADTSGTVRSASMNAATALSRSMMLSQLNTAVEVLLIALISSLSHLSSHVLGVLGWQGKYRLINTGIWGLCFMGAFLWSLFASLSDESRGFGPGENGILRFPTVCIVGFIPHLLILAGIAVCASIYVLALLFSTLSTSTGPWRHRFRQAQENLQANIHLSTVRISMHEDFYTTLLKIGFLALTAASEAVFLNEGPPVGVRDWTWLEEERMREIEKARDGRDSGFSLKRIEGGGISDGIGLDEALPLINEAGDISATSGYSKERTTLQSTDGKKGKKGARRRAGGPEGSRRWIMVWEFFRGIAVLLMRWTVTATGKIFDAVGISWRPRLLRIILRKLGLDDARKRHIKASGKSAASHTARSLGQETVQSLTEDTEESVRSAWLSRAELGDNFEQDSLDHAMYKQWVEGSHSGQLWGAVDTSGDWQPEGEELDDTTSVISSTTRASSVDWGDENSSDGRRTPVQADFRQYRYSSPIDNPIEPETLIRLLTPKTAEQKQESRLLARHLASDHILTRSAYKRSVEQEYSRVLTSSHRPTKLSPEEEAEVLEALILQRRSRPRGGAAWADGGGGLGSAGPQCVVCQSSPRTILIWPCRCLALCEECRVSLAMNNFANCVCCRRDVLGFSRIYVP